MRNLLLTFLTALFLLQGCSSVKGLFGKKGIMDPDDPNFLENIQKLKNSYKGGNVQALNELVSMYQDENQQTKARVIAGKALAQSQHPTALRAISKMVETTTAVDFTLLKESIEMLGMFEENPKAAIAMVKAMHRLEDRTNEIHLALAKNLNKVRTKDQVLALLDLYEVSKANLSKTEKLLTEILGALGNDQVIPVLTTIAKDPRANIGIRNMAVEILGKKNPDDVAIAFAELLGDPNTNMEVREFALNTMK
ncbi:MAG: HEAT repeat domain-containing protein, partial [Candidatus Neomarinimicrobiota bacterium]|nr:HEAT repeat domain-containing protein [Candidatus Neomarinimicrobiota bacterium]